MVLENRDVDVRDLLVGSEDEPIVACEEPRPGVESLDLQGVEPVSCAHHQLDAQCDVATAVRVAVLSAELVNRIEEPPVEKEASVEHVGCSEYAPKRRYARSSQCDGVLRA